MLTALLSILLFLIVWYYLRDQINHFKTGDPKENDQNYWMFSYDFEDDENHKKYWNKEIQVLNKKKRIRNRLIFLLYVDTIVIFILANTLVAKMMILIFN